LEKPFIKQTFKAKSPILAIDLAFFTQDGVVDGSASQSWKCQLIGMS